MGFQQGLSGLNVSSKALDAIGNNVANSNTVGFKSAQAQFSDVFAASLAGGGSSQVGIGATVSRISQQFTQGNVTSTNSALDLAVNGSGFFRLSDNGVITYTRNGQYQVDKDGYIVNGAGLHLTGYAADATGAIVPGNFTDLQLVTTNIAPAETTASQVQLNLDSRSTPPSSMISGNLTGAAAPPSLVITGANNTVDLTVDGIAASVDIPPAVYSTRAALAAAVETAINTNPTFAAAGTLVDVDVDTSNRIVITSRSVGTLGSQGSGSTVAAAATGDGEANLFGGVPVAVDGTDNFSGINTLSYTGSTAQTVFDSLGNAHNLTMYFAKTSATNTNTWQLYTALDGNFTGTTTTTSTYTVAPIIGATNIAAAANISVVVNGVATQVPMLAGGTPYASLAALQADLQASINAVFPVGARPTVTEDGTNLLITSAGNSVSLADGTAAPIGTAANLLGGAAVVAASVSTATTVTVPTPTNMTFSTSGALSGALTTTPLTLTFPITTGASALNFTVDFAGTSQYGISFGVNQLLQDGYTSGRLSGLSVASDGTIQGRYSNGKSRNMGQLVLANFNNPNGLQSMGSNQWAESVESGQPIPGTPGQGSLGVIQSAAIEESNVDLTAELVAMITQQRVYQANAQTIKTQDQVLSTLVNLR